MRIKYRILAWLSRRWCRLPKCWKYFHGTEVVHYIWWDGRKYDVWQYQLPLE